MGICSTKLSVQLSQLWLPMPDLLKAPREARASLDMCVHVSPQTVLGMIFLFIYRSENLNLIFEVNPAIPSLEMRSTPRLLDLISVIAPVVKLNSMGMLHFLKKVSSIMSSKVPASTPASDTSAYVRSMRVRKRDLLLKLLKLWKLVDFNMSATVAVAPLHCLSTNSMTRTVSDVAVKDAAVGSFTLKRHPMLRKVIFRPILWTSVVPCAILLMESVMSPAAETTASVTSTSKNFSSIPLLIPKKPPTLS